MGKMAQAGVVPKNTVRNSCAGRRHFRHLRAGSDRKGSALRATIGIGIRRSLWCATILAATGSGAFGQDQGMVPTPALNFYGLPGLIDMPTALTLPDGELSSTVSNFAGMSRYQFVAQFHPRVSGAFRYTQIDNFDAAGFTTYFDRSFDLRFTVLEESRTSPAVVVGVQDFIGTGIYGAEYVVATKTLLPQLTVSGGLGWGRLGSSGVLSGVGERADLTPEDVAEGGKPNLDSLFRGDIGFFGGVEWRPMDQLVVKVEYSSDEYILEDDELGIFERSSPFNFGVEYEPVDGVQLGGYYLYGSQFGLRLSFSFNPDEPVAGGSLDAGPPPVLRRPSTRAAPEAYETAWSQSTSNQHDIRETLAAELLSQNLEMEALSLGAAEATLYFRNTGYQAPAQAIGRAARVMTRTLPASVETFTIVVVTAGMELPAMTFTRSDLENLENAPDGTEAILAATVVTEGVVRPERADHPEGLYPRFLWQLVPYARTSLFDPDNPFRMDVGLEVGGGFELSPGLVLSGSIRKKVAGNLDQSSRGSDSTLPHVRSDFAKYDKEGDPGIESLTAAYFFQPAPEFYGRVTTGYLERMYAGVSTELLWAPYDSRLALGAELNYVRQRDYDGGFGFLDYEVLTGHASLYYRFTDDFYGQVDVGRYLAEDVGATFTLERVFANGWSVGAFATFTDVSADEFGEGSFDKGILLSVPLGWFNSRSNVLVEPLTIRPLQRDGGARLNVDKRLYPLVEDGQRPRVEEQWGRFWR